jgi:hypothetical protein
VKAQSFTAVIISVFFLLTVRTSAAAHLRLALTRSLKVFPDDALGGNRAADRTWLIPRNGHASIQFAVRSNTAIPEFTVSITLGGVPGVIDFDRSPDRPAPRVA